MARVEVFADVVCPFTHVGIRRLVDARAERAARMPLRVRAWPLEWVNGRPLDPRLVAREVDALRSSVAPDLFASFHEATFPRTSIPAFGLAAAAYDVDEPTGEQVSIALRAALFEEGLDVSDPEVLLSIGDRFGVTLPDARVAADAVRRDWERGKARGVQGSPHFFVGDHGWFCPTLRIRHQDEDYEVELDRDALRRFHAAALA